MSSDKEGSNVCLQVNMLGGFHILVNGKPLFSQAERSRQVMNLLAYLLLNRSSLASQQKLIEVLWPDDNSGDPTNALKNLVYRLRKALSRNDALSQFECVLLQNGHYIWNNKIPCRIDTELMEDYWKQACNLALGIPERIDLCSRALSLYKGRFLPDIEHGSWTVSLSSYYQNIYMSCVREAIRLLSLEQRFDEIFAICQTAIALEPYEELLHENLIKALIQMGKRQKALQHYHDISERFYRELGVKLGPSIRSLHKDILQSLNHVETNITAVKSELMEKACEGAFFCDYEIFKHLYRLEVRSAERGANSVLICLVTMSSYHNAMPSKEILNEAMAILKDCILSSLRKGDVVARFSPAQYILMINHTKVSVEKIVKRAVERFKNAYNSTFLKVSITTEPKVAILPVHVDKGQ